MISRTLRVAVSAVALAAATLAQAQVSGDRVRIGFITDLSGPFADNDGPGGLEAVKMAVADFGGKVLGKPIEVLSADHQNKADIASAKAREWADTQGMDMLVGGANSAAMLSINKMVPDKKFVFLIVSAGATQFTNDDCTPYTVQYAYNTTAVARTLGSAVVAQGGKSWYFLTTDYTFGHSLEAEATKIVQANGGQVLGKVRHPISASDFSSFLMQAQASKAQVLGLASSGSDTLNAIKGAREFGLTQSMKLAGLLMFVGNIDSLGLDDAQGLLLTESWYWDQNDASRAFAKRYFEKMKRMPNSLQAANYSATLSYLKSVEAAGTDNADKVMPEMRKMKIDDMYAKGSIRADGQMIHDFYLYEVKKPSESKRPWDVMKQVAMVPGDKAFAPLSESTCPLLKK
ncbi:branched-chain amino acid transport system substrate-binding protein [Comamonas sp. BIGb0124]|uniref:ABC transporter substrate-binding protein n=1 Tax=Comamonas sp. BIGb0124 TaxID=2485130 RepID=UPI000F48EF11|nr:ABC transporter substrate-binding protein [Comamonas sp. BIGb0124]ROR17135.1 branched-chain amino acid transport system substrate-binding protein [Comamonas sp. BIGb0124]